MHLSQISSEGNVRGGEHGSSLLEVMVATALLGLSAGALYSGMLQGSGMLQRARENLRANQVLVEKMETIRLYTFAQIDTPGFIPSTFTAQYQPTATGQNSSASVTYSGTTTVSTVPLTTSYVDDLRKVTVTVSWTTGGMLHQRDMSTWVSRNGLQNYVY